MSRRSVRVAEMMKRELGSLIPQEIQDPRMGFLTVVHVKCTADLRNARVQVSILGSDKDKEVTLSILEKTKKYLSGRIGDLLRLRYAPEIHFRLDDTLDQVEALENVFSQIQKSENNERPKRERSRRNSKDS